MLLSAAARVVRDTLRAYATWSRIELGTSVAHRRRRVHRRSTGSGRRVVLIAATFPPVVTGGTYRPLALARYGTRLGWEISVVGSDPRSISDAGRYLLRQVPAEVRVVRAQRARALRFARGVPTIDGTLAGAFDL